jgi:YD repeat-containing protein
MSGALKKLTTITIAVLLSSSVYSTTYANTYEYDDIGRLDKVTYPDGSTVDYTYDDAGNRTQKVTAGVSGANFVIDDVSAFEGEDLAFTARRKGDNSGAVGVSYASSNGTATQPGDYTSTSGTLSFAAGERYKTITVSSVQDTTLEGDETFNLVLSSATGGATITDSTGVGTVLTDEIWFTINDVGTNEGGNITWTVTRSGYLGGTNAIDYATAADGASASDFTATSGTLTFTSSQTTKTIVVATTNDNIHEYSETFRLNLTNATGGASISDNQGAGTIVDNDVAPSFSISNQTVDEGSAATFTITKTGLTSKSHAVSYTTNVNSAGASDFVAKSSTLTFTSGQTSQTVAVTTNQDTTYENNERYFLDLSGATNGATISDSRGDGWINNDDTAPSFSINNKTVSEGGTLSFTVTKTGATAKTHAVNYATANGTATTADYTAKSGTLTFTSGQTGKTVSVSTTEETTWELNETMAVNLSSATAGATISDSQEIGTINNDDPNTTNAVNDSYNMNQFSTLSAYVLSNDSDPQGHSFSITSVTQPSNAVVTIKASGTYLQIYATDGGLQTFSYTNTDSYGATDAANVTVNVQASGGGGGPGGPPL